MWYVMFSENNYVCALRIYSPDIKRKFKLTLSCKVKKHSKWAQFMKLNIVWKSSAYIIRALSVYINKISLTNHY